VPASERGAAGLAAGLLATAQMRGFLSPQTGKPVTRAGLAYALVWAAIMVAGTAFSYGSQHWFAHLGTAAGLLANRRQDRLGEQARRRAGRQQQRGRR